MPAEMTLSQLKLCLKSDDGVFPRLFKIRRRISAGASVTCYEATLDEQPGILREFCPADREDAFFGLLRDTDGQLVYEGAGMAGPRKTYCEARDRYLAPYRQLLRCYNEDSEFGMSLEALFPKFTIYYGWQNGQALDSAYIWSPGFPKHTFQDTCDAVQCAPFTEPENKLRTVLTQIRALAEAICTLHQANWLHRDIKPQNFGFTRLQSGAAAQTISLFDLDSLYYNDTDVPALMGTEGYMEMEARSGSRSYFPTAQTDIYAIGATLARGILVPFEDFDIAYHIGARGSRKETLAQFRKRIHAAVQHSRLIRISVTNAAEPVCQALTELLVRTLSPRADRYQDCESLIAALDQLLSLLTPAVQPTQRQQRRLRQWEAQRDKALLTHLYAHPLYEAQEGHDLNVTLLGLGSTGRLFLDLCLQAGQMAGRMLHVTVLSRGTADRDAYLAARPGLRDFFCIDGQLPAGNICYGHVSFLDHPLPLNTADTALTAHLANCLFPENGPSAHYVMIALGNDAHDVRVANACRQAAAQRSLPCTVHCVLDAQEVPDSLHLGIHPVLLGKVDTTAFQELDRMGFNCHLIWNNDPRADRSEVHRDYLDPYNRISNLGLAMSLPYKLKSLGFDLTQAACPAVADALARLIEEKRSRPQSQTADDLDLLIDLEHRRWVTEKVCQGWTPWTDYAQSAKTGSTRDSASKRHICLVPTVPGMRLTDDAPVWTSQTDPSALPHLDGLEKASIHLYRAYQKAMAAARRDVADHSDQVDLLRKDVAASPKATAAFYELYSCVTGLWNADASMASFYSVQRTAFLDTVKTEEAEGILRRDTTATVKLYLKAVDRMAAPFIGALKKTNFKHKDQQIIYALPYILTSQPDCALLIPLVADDEEDIYQNVLAATHLDPKVLIYLCQAPETSREEKHILRCAERLCDYMTRRRLRAQVRFLLLHDAVHVPTAFAAALQALAPSRIRQTELLPCRDLEDIIPAVRSALQDRTLKKLPLAAQQGKDRLSFFLAGGGFYASVPYFTIDSATLRIRNGRDCQWAAWYPFHEHLRISDVLAFQDSAALAYDPPAFQQDIGWLWDAYQQHTAAWKELCTLLSRLTEANDRLATFQGTLHPDKTLLFQFMLPAQCGAAMRKLVDYMKQEDVRVLAPASFVSITPDRCTVTAYAYRDVREAFAQLLEAPHLLYNEELIRCHTFARFEGDVSVAVTYDHLRVGGVQLTDPAKFAPLLQLLTEKQFISRRVEKPAAFAPAGTKPADAATAPVFTLRFATPQIKQLLTSAGKVLELHVYHLLKKSRFFDDLVASYEVTWGDALKNEFDCVGIRGSRIVFIECKATINLDQNYFYKLDALARSFGVNEPLALLIADTRETAHTYRETINAMHRRRGDRFGIVTIYTPEDIRQLPQAVEKAFNDHYGIK